MDGVRNAERAVTVAARPLVRDLVPVAAHRAAGDAKPRAVHGDEVVDLALQLLVEEMPRAAQVARALLTDVADEVHGPAGLYVGPLERARHGEKHGETAAVVADAGRLETSTIA